MPDPLNPSASAFDAGEAACTVASLAAFSALLQAHAPAAPLPFVPEVVVHQATALVPVWGALDELLGAGSAGSPAPFWAIPWVGGQALARFLLSAPERVAGKATLDFAAGSGAAGIAALQAGASSVLATELDAMAVAVMAHNAALNGLSVGTEGLLPSLENVVGVFGPWQVVLAGDVCYERGPAGVIFQWLRDLAADRLVLLADPGRAFLPADGLLALARYTVPAHLDTEGVSTRETTVYQVLPR